MTLRALIRRPSPMPTRHPRVAHFMPYLMGDAIYAPRRARRLRYRYIDMNGNCDRDGWVWLIHWAKYRMQYRWVVLLAADGKVRRDAKGREVRARVPAAWPEVLHELSSGQVKRLRSAKRGGSRPYTAAEGMIACEEADVTLCLEAKGSPLFLTPEPWEWLHAWAVKTGVSMVVMTLQNVYRKGHPEDPYTRLWLAIEHGFAVALLPRMKRPASWAIWESRGVQLWGKWKR
ncbi:MAG: hypothetical protein J7518_14995 [Nocardioidaceae bacterium]|nr:hypothetical protein [Nocardioidaceae bacterium]